MLEGLAEAIADGSVWVIDRDEAIAGVLIVSIVDDRALLENVAIAPGNRGLGFGRQLIEQAVSIARDGGCGEIRLTTHAKMTGNVALYEHLGWRVSERQGNRVVMLRDLRVQI